MAVTFRTYRDAHVALRIPGSATALRRRILLLPRITYHYRLTNYQNTAVSARLVIAIQSYHLTKPPSLLQRVTPHHPAAPAPFIPRSCTQWNPMCDVRGRGENLNPTRSSETSLTAPSTVALLNPPLQFAHARCCTRRLQQVPPPPPPPPPITSSSPLQLLVLLPRFACRVHGCRRSPHRPHIPQSHPSHQCTPRAKSTWRR